MKIEISSARNSKSSKFQHTLFIGTAKGISGHAELSESLQKELHHQINLIKKEEFKAEYEKWGNGNSTVFLFALPKKPGLSTLDNYRFLGAQIKKGLQKYTASEYGILADQLGLPEIEAMFQGLYHAEYTFEKYKSKPKPSFTLKFSVVVHTDLVKSANEVLKKVSSIHSCLKITRDFINTPGSDLTPEVYASHIGTLAKKSGLQVKVRKWADLKKEGFQGLISVGKGSPHLPAMVTLEYNASKKNVPHLGILGKGITFDTGGISLKPGSGMWEMKSDMSGSATVLGAILACAELKLPLRVTAVMVLAENRPGNDAILPGDIFTAKNGKTVMVDNTDAEGRLVLSDGLWELQSKKPQCIIDLATLTGAMVRALGTSMAGVFSNRQSLSSSLISAGATTGEKLWPMPLEHEYTEQLDDYAADMKNIGKPEGGAITAALFLEKFVEESMPWAHIDIAGVAFHTSAYKYYPVGASGWGLQTLVQLAQDMVNKSMTKFEA